MYLYKNNFILRNIKFVVSGDYTTKEKLYRCIKGRGKIPTYLLYNFLNRNNIDFAIRGHTDNIENAYLLSNYNDTLPLNNTSIHYDNNFIIFPKDTFNNPYISQVRQTDGYVARIKTDNWYTKFNNNSEKFLVKIKKDNVDKYVYPLLTISTNSDIYKKLNKDSFIILNINDNSNQESKINTECKIGATCLPTYWSWPRLWSR